MCHLTKRNHTYIIFITVPVFMSAPIATAISSTAVNLTWSPPTDEELLGQVVMYKVYWNRPNNLELNPFAPEFTWTVSYLLF